uniref:Uncharacterized protein n=1 Tax=Nelumbo nucifera TaxID=4432 RepID=A0A822XHT1_NELNU|nr:TPA_asm: hypothetical protein HUJ06_022507 [Nelumbo nucifera]
MKPNSFESQGYFERRVPKKSPSSYHLNDPNFIFFKVRVVVMVGRDSLTRRRIQIVLLIMGMGGMGNLTCICQGYGRELVVVL